MHDSILEYLFNNKINIKNYFNSQDMTNLEKINRYFNVNITKSDWIILIQKLFKAEEFIEYDKFFLVKVSDTHKITISKPANLKKIAYFLENN